VNARAVAFAAALMFAAGVLAGCTAPAPDITGDTATGMQTTVVSIAESAAAGDASGALAKLDGLQQQLDAAITDGSVSAQRAAAIQTRIDVVRADLQPVPAVEPAPDPAVSEDTGETSVTNDDSGTGNGNSGPDKPGTDKPGKEKPDKEEGGPGKGNEKGGKGND